MKILHTSDLHLGRRINNYSMIEVQQKMLEDLLEIALDESVSAILISGDIYDKTDPCEESVRLFDRFLSKLSKTGIPTFITRGNHDSATRLGYGSELIEGKNIFITPVFDGNVRSHILRDEHGEVEFFLLPFIKPSDVRHLFPEKSINTYADAVRTVVESIQLNPHRRNVILAHQFVLGGVRCESEQINVGGTDAIPAQIFSEFDFVALGHLHRPQRVDKGEMYYSGSPLKYSLSEVGDKKSVVVADLGEKGNISVERLPITPLRDMREVVGTFHEIVNMQASDDYIFVTLTDDFRVENAISALEEKFQNFMSVRYKNLSSDNLSANSTAPVIENIEQLNNDDRLELFGDFFALQSGRELSGEQENFLREQLDEIFGI